MNIAIIGSNRGVGLKLVEKFNTGNNKVYAFCREASNELKSLEPKSVIEDFDVSKTEQMKQKLDNLNVENFDTVIHVAGILKEDSSETFDEDLIEQFKVNSIGPINTYNSFFNYLNAGSKFAVLTSQLGSVAKNESGGRFGYRMSKAAANMACKNIAVKAEKSKITVLILHPGYVETDMTGHDANITSSESAAGLKKLINNKNTSDNGTFWHVNGEQLPW